MGLLNPGNHAAGCAIHVAAREARVVADLKRLVGSVGWDLHPSTTHALRATLAWSFDHGDR